MIFARRDFMEWNEYKARIDLFEEFNFRQAVRKQSVRNLAVL